MTLTPGQSPPIQYTIPFYNDSGETIPAYGVIQARSAENSKRLLWTVEKPTGDGKLFFINMGISVKDRGYGVASAVGPVRVLAPSVPSFGGEFGPSPSGGWLMTSDGKGWTYCGGWDQQSALAMKLGGGGGGDGGLSGINFARVTNPISKTSGNLVEDWGSGSINLLAPMTGEILPQTFSCVNPTPQKYLLDYWVEVDERIIQRGYVNGLPVFTRVWTVLNGSCGEFQFWKDS